MMAAHSSEADLLLERAAKGDAAARDQLLMQHQARLRQMIRLRMDRRLAARVDPSDLVQETLVEAVQKLSDYLRRRPLPFYPWLRQLAWERLVDLHRRHIRAQKRSVRREEHAMPPLPGSSAHHLADRLVAHGSSPSSRLKRLEVRNRVKLAFSLLSEIDREVLVLKHLEQLSTPEIAAILKISEGAFYTRHVRALERLKNLLQDTVERVER
ncbi:MAG: sigma-70 family RNA polymerase sigma factor [Gemmataceae bacterium]